MYISKKFYNFVIFNASTKFVYTTFFSPLLYTYLHTLNFWPTHIFFTRSHVGPRYSPTIYFFIFFFLVLFTPSSTSLSSSTSSHSSLYRLNSIQEYRRPMCVSPCPSQSRYDVARCRRTYCNAQLRNELYSSSCFTEAAACAILISYYMGMRDTIMLHLRCNIAADLP